MAFLKSLLLLLFLSQCILHTSGVFEDVFDLFGESEPEPEEEDKHELEFTWLGILASLKTAGGVGAFAALIPAFTQENSVVQALFNAYTGEDRDLAQFLEDNIFPFVLEKAKMDPSVAKGLETLMTKDPVTGITPLKKLVNTLNKYDVIREDWQNVLTEIFVFPNDTKEEDLKFSVSKMLPLFFKGKENVTIPLDTYIPIALAFIEEPENGSLFGFDIRTMVKNLLSGGCNVTIGTALKVVHPILDGEINEAYIDHLADVISDDDVDLDVKCLVDSIFMDKNRSAVHYAMHEILKLWVPTNLTNTTGSMFDQLLSGIGFDNFMKELTGKHGVKVEALVPMIRNIIHGGSLRSNIMNILISLMIGTEQPEGMGDLCWDHIMTMKMAFIELKEWAMNLLDSWGKLRSGVMNGQLAYLGQYDQCLRTSGQILMANRSEPTTIQGEYCKATLDLDLGEHAKDMPDFDIQLGVCVPNMCSQSEVMLILKRIIGKVPRASVSRVSCVEEAEIYLANDIGATLVAAFVGSFLFSIITFTCVDRVCCRRKRYRRYIRSHGHKVINSTPTEITLTELSSFGSTTTTITSAEGCLPQCGDEPTGCLPTAPSPKRILRQGSVGNSSSSNGDTISRGSEEEETSVRRSLLGVNNKRPAKHEIPTRRRHHSSPGGRGIIDDEPAYFRMSADDSDSEDSEYYNDKPAADIEGAEFGGKNDTDMQVVYYDDGCSEPVMGRKDSDFDGDDPRCCTTLRLVTYAFSLTSNLKRLLSTKTTAGPTAVVHGMRVISLIWFVQFSIGDFAFLLELSENILELAKQTEQLPSQVAMSAVLAIDTFFFISGFVASYMFCVQLSKIMERDDKVKNTLKATAVYYIHGIVKFTPLYIVVLLSFAYLVPFWGSGPMWTTADHPMMDNCRSGWGWNAIYLNNLVKTDQKSMCMPWTWYIATDFQFYVIAPFILILITVFPRIGISVLVFMTLACSAVIAGLYYTVYDPKQHPEVIAKDIMSGDFSKIYIKPWTRFAPYGVGMLLGYLVSKRDTNKIPGLKTWHAILGWLLCTALALLLLLGSYSRHCAGCDRWGLAVSMLWESSRHLLWSVCMAWIVFACWSGYGGVVTSILSWKAFVPLSRLLKGTYLIHPLIMYIVFHNRKQTLAFDNYIQVIIITGFVFTSFFATALLSLVYEWPLLQLEHLIYRHIRLRSAWRKESRSVERHEPESQRAVLKPRGAHV